MRMQPVFETAETLRARRPDLGTGVQRFGYVHVTWSPLVGAGLEAKAKSTWRKMGEVEYRLEPARCRPVGTSGTEGPRAAPAPASAPDWKRPQPDLCRSGEDKIGQGYTGSMWVRGTTYAQAAGAGAINPDQAAQILARLTQ